MGSTEVVAGKVGEHENPKGYRIYRVVAGRDKWMERRALCHKKAVASDHHLGFVRGAAGER
ncbi:hypothetical protein [Devosia sp.]|uniref:hypothetical protein n=1 Tax=Devosia sp. TaxID=1871048 RepID=UPI003263D722